MPPETEVKNPPQVKLKFYKSKKFKWLLIIIAIVMIVGGAGLFGWYRVRAASTKKTIQSGLHELVQQSDKVTSYQKDNPTPADLGDFSSQLRNLEQLVKDKKYQVSQLSRRLNNTTAITAFEDFLNRLGEYANKASGLSEDLKAVEGTDLDDLEKLAEATKSAAEQIKAELKLNESLPAAIFDTPNFISDIHDKLLQQESELAKAAEKAAQDKQAVEDNVSKFMQAFIGGDATQMKRYMTDAYVKEYDFNQLSADSRQYFYPDSFRIVETKQEDDRYDVKVNTVNINKQDTKNKYTNGVIYVVIFDKGYNKWLINLQEFNQGGGY